MTPLPTPQVADAQIASSSERLKGCRSEPGQLSPRSSARFRLTLALSLLAGSFPCFGPQTAQAEDSKAQPVKPSVNATSVRETGASTWLGLSLGTMTIYGLPLANAVLAAPSMVQAGPAPLAINSLNATQTGAINAVVGATLSVPGPAAGAVGATAGNAAPNGTTNSSQTGAGANGANAPASSNMTGTVTGTVTSNQTGNLTGTVTGTVTGNLTGNSTGNAALTSGDNSGSSLSGNAAGKLPPPMPYAIQSMLLLDDLAHARVLTATPDTLRLPADVRQTLYDALDFRADLETEAGFFTVLSLRWMGRWAIATVTPTDVSRAQEGEEHRLSPDDLMNLLIVSTPQGWEAALEDDPYVQALLTWIPQKELSEEARATLFSTDARPSRARRTIGLRLGASDKRATASGARDGAWMGGMTSTSGSGSAKSSDVGSLGTAMGAERDAGNGSHDGKTGGSDSSKSIGKTADGTTNASRVTRSAQETALIMPAQPEIVAPGSGTVSYVCNDGTFAALLLSASEAPRQWLLTGIDPGTLSLYAVGVGSQVNEGQRLGDAAASGNGLMQTACTQFQISGVTGAAGSVAP